MLWWPLLQDCSICLQSNSSLGFWLEKKSSYRLALRITYDHYMISLPTIDTVQMLIEFYNGIFITSNRIYFSNVKLVSSHISLIGLIHLVLFGADSLPILFSYWSFSSGSFPCSQDKVHSITFCENQEHDSVLSFGKVNYCFCNVCIVNGRFCWLKWGILFHLRW